jgi:two-component system chemotaxis response regulator CheB
LTADGLLSAQSEELDKALWTAFRTLQENASLARRVAERAHGNGRPAIARRFEDRARSAEQQAGTIRKLLLSDKLSGPVNSGTDQDNPDKPE